MSVVSKSVPVEAFPSLHLVEPIKLKYYPIFLFGLIGSALFNVLRTKYFGQIQISFPSNVMVKVPKGTSILEASKSKRIP